MADKVNQDAIRAGIKVLCQRLHKSNEFIHPAENFTIHTAMYDIVNDILTAAKPFMGTEPRKQELRIIHGTVHAAQTDLPKYAKQATAKPH